MSLSTPSPPSHPHTLTRLLYTVIVVVVLLVIGGVLTAFLYPRNVDIAISQINSTNDWVELRPVVAPSNSSTNIAILEMQVLPATEL